MKSRFIVLLLSLLISVFAHGQGIDFTKVDSAEDWDRISRRSLDEGKLIFVDAYADWCGFCKQMDREVFSDSDLARDMEDSFIAVKIDGESEYGNLWVSSYGIEAYPMYLFLNSSGIQVGVIEGYRELDDFSDSVISILDNAEKLESLSEGYEAGELSNQETADYILIVAQNDPEEAERMSKFFIGQLTEEEFLAGDYLDLMVLYGWDVQGKVWPWIKENFSELSTRYDEELWYSYFQKLFEEALLKSLREENLDLLVKVIKEVLPVYLPSRDERAMAAFYALKAYFGHFDDAESYSSIVEEYYKDKVVGVNIFFEEAQEILELYQTPNMLYLANLYLKSFTTQMPESFPGMALLSYSYLFLGDYGQAKEILDKARGMAVTAEDKSFLDDLDEAISRTGNSQGQ